MPRSRRPGSILEQLGADEARAVLRHLLEAHPELRAEAEQAARSLLGRVSFKSVADDLERALRALDLDALKSRAGRHRDGYTPPTEAAWQLLRETVDPFLADLKRHLGLGLETEALEICKGIVLGLYRIRHTRGHEFLGWAEDFPAEAAEDALRVLAQGNRTKGGRVRRASPSFDQRFIDRFVPEWSDLVTQTLDEK